MARVVKAARCRTLWRSRGSQVDRTPQRLRWMLNSVLKHTGSRYCLDTVTTEGFSSFIAWNSGSVERHRPPRPVNGASWWAGM